MDRTPDEANEPPRPEGAFSNSEALALLLAYRKNPSDVPCPRCGPDTVEVLGFVEPEVDPGGFATPTDPQGQYAVALYCHRCRRAIGILPGAGRPGR